MSCNGCIHFRYKEKLGCDEKIFPKEFRFCTEFANERLKLLDVKQANKIETRIKGFIKDSWGPNDANFE